jgi:hypothetical protein
MSGNLTFKTNGTFFACGKRPLPDGRKEAFVRYCLGNGQPTIEMSYALYVRLGIEATRSSSVSRP